MTFETVRLSDVCAQDRASVRAGERPDLRYLGLESIEAHSGALAQGDMSKTPDAPEANSFLFTDAHVLYGKLRPYLNKVYVPAFTGKCSTELVPLRPSERVQREFLAYYLRAPSTVDKISTRVAGARMPRADMNYVMSLPIPVPPREEQRRVVDLLSRAENIVRMRREAEQKAKEIIPALFMNMFGDPATNPKGWAVKRVGDIVERFEGGKNVQAGEANDSAFRILKISAVTSGVYDESESKPAPSGLRPPAHYFVRNGDFLFSRANTEALVGATAIAAPTDSKSLLPDKLWRLVWRSGETIYSSYMLALLQNGSVRRALSQIASGTGGSMKNISQAKLAELKLPIAREDLQRSFDEKVSALQSISRGASRARRVANQAFQSLLAEIFRETP